MRGVRSGDLPEKVNRIDAGEARGEAALFIREPKVQEETLNERMNEHEASVRDMDSQRGCLII